MAEAIARNPGRPPPDRFAVRRAGAGADSVLLTAMPNPDTRGEQGPKLTLPHADPVAVEMTSVIHRGDLDRLGRLLGERPELASVRMIGRTGLEGGWRTPLHVAADWPGYFPRASAAVGLLLDLGPPAAAPGSPTSACGTCPCDKANRLRLAEIALSHGGGGADHRAASSHERHHASRLHRVCPSRLRWG